LKDTNLLEPIRGSRETFDNALNKGFHLALKLVISR
jgi:hypothetical protein